MNIFIRTDSSTEIGTGHVMRCLTLAMQLERFGANITFICRELEGNSIQYLRLKGFKVIPLSSHRNTINDIESIRENWLLDLEETRSLVGGIEIDIVIVDHYSLDRRWEEKIRNVANIIMVIDDLANREHDCDFLLDQNYYPNMDSRYIDLVSEDCILMLGPNYVLLRDEFIEAARKPRKRTGKIENLLIFFGGTDPTGETVKTLNSIKKMNSFFKNIDVVVGSANPDRDEINMLCNSMTNTHFYCQISNMAELMWKADLSVGAGGSSTWERCILGLPSIVVRTAENQRELIEALSCKKVILKYNSRFSDFQEIIFMLLRNPEFLINMNLKSREIVDIHKIKTYPVATKMMGEIL